MLLLRIFEATTVGNASLLVATIASVVILLNKNGSAIDVSHAIVFNVMVNGMVMVFGW